MITFEIDLNKLTGEELINLKEIAERIGNYDIVNEISEFIHLREW